MTGPTTPDAHETRLVTTPDGRTLEVLLIGPEDGLLKRTDGLAAKVCLRYLGKAHGSLVW